MAEQKNTKLDEDVTKPATVEPGDAPADTTDPTEEAVSVPSQPGEEAVKAGTVNTVKPAPKRQSRTREGKDRVEKYQATKPDGTQVTVEHDIDTGETKVS